MGGERGAVRVPCSPQARLHPLTGRCGSSTRVLGIEVTAGNVDLRDRYDIVAICSRGKHAGPSPSRTRRPDGVSMNDISAESGLRAQVVGRVLAAMEAVDAARRVAGESGGEVWARGEGGLSTVDLDNVTPTIECPNCAHRIPLPAGARRTGPRRVAVSAPGVNGDGQAKFAKGELRQLVLDFVNATPATRSTRAPWPVNWPCRWAVSCPRALTPTRTR